MSAHTAVNAAGDVNARSRYGSMRPDVIRRDTKRTRRPRKPRVRGPVFPVTVTYVQR